MTGFPAALKTDIIRRVSRTLTHTEITNLNATPIVLAAGVPGKTPFVHSGVFKWSGGTPYVLPDPDVWVSISTPGARITSVSNGFWEHKAAGMLDMSDGGIYMLDFQGVANDGAYTAVGDPVDICFDRDALGECTEGAPGNTLEVIAWVSWV